VPEIIICGGYSVVEFEHFVMSSMQISSDFTKDSLIYDVEKIFHMVCRFIYFICKYILLTQIIAVRSGTKCSAEGLLSTQVDFHCSFIGNHSNSIIT
jgi:hypothetical protein